MDELTIKLGVLITSRRWLAGDAIVTIINHTLLRPGKPLATDRIENICVEYAAWECKVARGVSPTQLSESEMRQLDKWIGDLDDAFDAILRSNRWKIGSLLVGTVQAVRGRRGKPQLIAEVKELFNTYKELTRNGAPKQKPVIALTLADVYFRLGFAHEKSKNWSSAGNAYEAALVLSPPRPGQFYRLGRVREHQRQWREAVSAYKESVSRNPNMPHWFFRLGNACAKAGFWAEAVSAFESATTRNATQSEWFYRLGQAREKVQAELPQYFQHGGLKLRRQGDFPGAARAYSAAITLDETQALYHFRLGHVRDKMRDFDAAAGAFAEAVRLAPEKSSWLYRLGRAREQALDLEGALDAFQQLLALQPDHTGARSRSYTIYVKLSRWEAASRCALTHDRATSPYPAAVVHLRSVLESVELRVAEDEVQRTLIECEEFAHLLPVDWWFALHWRFMASGWFSLAYRTKDIAASLIVLRSDSLATLGITKYVEIAKALVQLESKDAAIEHLQTMLKQDADNEASFAAQKLIADIEAFHGNPSLLEDTMGKHHGVSLPEAEAEFRQLICNKNVAIVGPVRTGLNNGNEIDSYDAVIRPNFLPGSASLEVAATAGSRTDVSYFNGVASKMLAGEIQKAVEQRALQLVVLRPFNYCTGKQLIVRPGDLRYNPNESNALLRARSFGIQRIMHDVLKYRPRSIKLFNIDFFTGPSNYKRGYTAGQLLVDIDPYFVGSGHDYRSDFLFTKSLREQSLVSGDSLVEEILQLSADSYLSKMDRKDDRESDLIVNKGAGS